jgi:GNAT superfamily N-acetyltransferase
MTTHTTTQISDDYYHVAGDGFDLNYILFEDEDVIYVERIDVDEDVRGQGIGTAVLRQLAKEFYAVFVAPENATSKGYFEHIGEDAYEMSAHLIDELGLWAIDQGYGIYEI